MRNIYECLFGPQHDGLILAVPKLVVAWMCWPAYYGVKWTRQHALAELRHLQALQVRK